MHPMFQHRIIIFAILLLALCALPAAAASTTKQDFKLRAGARGEACLTCHTDFAEKMEQTHLHPLVKAKDCTSCHQSHASSHEGLLTAAPTRLCLECHAEILPKEFNSAHSIVVTGNCQQCHDSHGSAYPSILTQEGDRVCFECHADIGQKTQNARFKHEPVDMEKGCLNCHRPHASEKQNHLLKAAPPTLCLDCHRTNEARFKRKHNNYRVDDFACSDCHSPHGSDRRGIIYETAHAPLAEGNCAACHNPPGSARQTTLKKQGMQLCRQCHERWIDRQTGNNRVHWPMLTENGCNTCHTPHASREEKLVRGTPVQVCGKCHADTVALQERSKKGRKDEKLCEPVRQGQCNRCHAPHGGRQVLLFETSSSIELCGRCHEWQTHSTHPIGETVIDTRNKNLTLDCLSCHRGCGTADNPMMLSFATTYDLCVSCHVDRRR
ncbi:MAG: hypothetical protein AMJ54_07915 [Deltaproteobacteria bacterium SG8_13]|nr:MAG: hypothetical protein AMJ54_07915 [Deltaproteobacteria bacterium SG8_13]